VGIRREPAPARFVKDVLRIVFFAIIVLSVVSAVIGLQPIRPPWRDTLGRVIAALAAEIVAVTLLRQIIPKPATGQHRVGKGGAYFRWLISSTFAEVGMNPILRGPFWFLHSTRGLYLRALGADLAWRISIPHDVVIHEPSMISIGSGAQLEGGVKVECALHGAGRVRIHRVSIGEGCLIGAHTALMPGATIAHEARIGPGVFIGFESRVGVGASIGARAVIGEQVDVGSYAVIGGGAVLSDGVRVLERGRVLSGAVVPPNIVIGERETFPPASSPWGEKVDPSARAPSSTS
jgi:carbonic anhydrase/acetyltransferase-like protein (isoleucine patch superfamily)